MFWLSCMVCTHLSLCMHESGHFEPNDANRPFSSLGYFRKSCESTWRTCINLYCVTLTYVRLRSGHMTQEKGLLKLTLYMYFLDFIRLYDVITHICMRRMLTTTSRSAVCEDDLDEDPRFCYAQRRTASHSLDRYVQRHYKHDRDCCLLCIGFGAWGTKRVALD